MQARRVVTGKYQLTVGDSVIHSSNEITYEGILSLAGRSPYSASDDPEVPAIPNPTLFGSDNNYFIINLPSGGISEAQLYEDQYIGEMSDKYTPQDSMVDGGVGIRLGVLGGQMFFPNAVGDTVINSISCIGTKFVESFEGSGQTVEVEIVLSTTTLPNAITLPQGHVLAVEYYLEVNSRWDAPTAFSMVDQGTEAQLDIGLTATLLENANVLTTDYENWMIDTGLVGYYKDPDILNYEPTLDDGGLLPVEDPLTYVATKTSVELTVTGYKIVYSCRIYKNLQISGIDFPLLTWLGPYNVRIDSNADIPLQRIYQFSFDINV